MFAKIIALFALLAVAFAAPKPQYLASGLDYVYPSAGYVPSVYSAYAEPISYPALPVSAYSAPYYVR